MKIENSDNRGPFALISDFFEGAKKVIFFHFISKELPYLSSLNTLELESIKILYFGIDR